MIDIKPLLAEELEEFAAVELTFGRTERTLPLITITEMGNRSEAVFSGKERLSRITLQLDVYAETAQEVESLSVIASAILIGRGLKRTFFELDMSEEVPRGIMRFSCGVDEADGRILSL